MAVKQRDIFTPIHVWNNDISPLIEVRIPFEINGCFCSPILGMSKQHNLPGMLRYLELNQSSHI